MHRPEFEAFKRDGIEDRKNGTKFREWYLWPSINLEDLKLKRSLLHLLNACGPRPPRDFSYADSDSFRLGFVTGAFDFPWLPCHIMFLNGQAPDTYGRLVCHIQHSELAKDLISAGRTVPMGYDFATLEVRQRIMSFLVGCCKSILHDLNEQDIYHSVYPALSAVSELKIYCSEYSSIAMMTIESQYRVPANIDFRRLRALVAAKWSHAEDHICALREELGYFAEALANW